MFRPCLGIELKAKGVIYQRIDQVSYLRIWRNTYFDLNGYDHVGDHISSEAYTKLMTPVNLE